MDEFPDIPTQRPSQSHEIKSAEQMISSKSSEDLNTHRIEMLWTSKIQATLIKWRKRIAEEAVLHNKAAKKNKIRFRIFGVAGPLLTLIVGALSPYLEKNIVYGIVLATAACLTAINTACNFGQTAQKHSMAEGDYEKLGLRMEWILSQSKSDRDACDVIMTEMRMTMSEIAMIVDL